MHILARSYKKACGTLSGIRYQRGSTPVNSDVPVRVTLDISRYVYARYFFSFVKFLALEGMGVDLRLRPETIYDISRAQYGSRVLSERLVTLTNFSRRGRMIGDRRAEVGFGPYDFEPSRDPAIYDVPMAQHPLMYAKGLWNQPVQAGMPCAAILFVGNYEPGIYTRIESEGLFDVIGRIRLREILCGSGLAREASPADFGKIAEGFVTLVDSARCPVQIEDFRQLVSSFGFFLCAPGAFMPLCHNLIEAMSVGTIPLIQRSYAELLQPALEQGKNAIVFENEEDLTPCVKAALQMSPEEIGSMKRRVLHYYEQNLAPQAVVARVMAPEVRRIRMLAGEFSLAMLRESRNGKK
jgi:hypothetical protein